MNGDLLINGKDAWTTWGVRMGEDFLNVIDGFNEMKDYIENESRLEHGKRVITDNAKVDSREITLQFTIEGCSESDYRSKKKAFQTELIKQSIILIIILKMITRHSIQTTGSILKSKTNKQTEAWNITIRG